MSSLTPFGPPRPCAIATLLTSKKDLLQCQTVLYSIQQAHSKTISCKNDNNGNSNKINNGFEYEYPPERILFVTSNISNDIEQDLKFFCDRVIWIAAAAATANNRLNNHSNNVDYDQFAKIHLLNHCEYDRILIIDSHCLVINDLSHVFQNYNENDTGVTPSSRGLITAAAGSAASIQIDDDSNDKFNQSIMVIKPNYEMYKEMVNQFRERTSSDNSQCATDFWNAYFHSAWIQLPLEQRLGSEYYYTREIHKNNKNQIYIVNNNSNSQGGSKVVDPSIDQLCQKMIKKSQIYKENQREKQILDQKAKKQAQQESKKQKSSDLKNDPHLRHENDTKRKQMEKHGQVTKRYKELRKQGINTQDSMRMARTEYGLDKDDEKQKSPNRQVASMFGL